MLNTLFRQKAVPKKYQKTFLHLYFDIGWYGVLNGSILGFLIIYAARLGANGFQIGLISAVPAVVSLFLAIPAGRWLRTKDIRPVIFWTSLANRIGFIPLIFIPWIFNESNQITIIIVLTFLAAIPLTSLNVGFNALFAEAVPDRYRSHVAGIRNIMLSITLMITSFTCGYILNRVAFPTGYQIVFGIGAFGALMSSYHLYFVKPARSDSPPLLPPLESASLKKILSPRKIIALLNFDIWKTSFRKVLLGLGALHLTQLIAVPIFPLYFIHGLNLQDNHIGIGNALFYLTALLGSTQLRKVVHKIGNKNLTGLGMNGLALYPLILSQSTEVWQFYAVSFLGGFTFAMVNGSYANYMLENIPSNDRHSHLAWYNIILSAATLIGSLGGPAIANTIGLTAALMLFALLRFLTGVFILKWG